MAQQPPQVPGQVTGQAGQPQYPATPYPPQPQNPSQSQPSAPQFAETVPSSAPSAYYTPGAVAYSQAVSPQPARRGSAAGAIWLWGGVFGAGLAVLVIINYFLSTPMNGYLYRATHSVFMEFFAPQLDSLLVSVITSVACFAGGLMAARQAQRAGAGVWAGLIVATLGGLASGIVAILVYQRIAGEFFYVNFAATSIGQAQLVTVVSTFLIIPLKMAIGAGFGALGALLALRRR